ncbi:hypothetical protein pdam_00018182 [Pocillopora damicornis]|uniref:Rho-GAP domain-containing protein n=1 Tax=Pocillopora damicornis TaxID=46731 RepID=A0A3M6TUP2_POCDA|nr:uncharacterized protein LOC113673058 isoform X1 [Pocillopora damicornis]RMX44964.1 hypothetical protein pdam_00018182 [Pocillopora damicornis]
MKHLSSIDFKDNVRFIVRKDLKDIGIKVPKQKNCKVQPVDKQNRSGVFGVCLEKVTSVNVGKDFYCSVPKFVVDSANFLQQHLETEGLFRKSGSIQRQKLLKLKAENGEEFQNVQPHDVASLVKQFFRQLPEPLLTNQLHDCFIKAQRKEDHGDQKKAILLLCLLLPIAHLNTLQFTMKFLAKVAKCSHHSKMGTSNLAIVLTPNLIHNTKKEGNSASEKQLKEQTAVIDIILKNAEEIGLVSEYIYERAKMIGDEFVDGMTSSGDELDVDDNWKRGNKRQSRARTRTGSLSGFVSGLGQSLSKFKNSSSAKTPVHTHRRSRSMKAELMRNKVKYNLEENVLDKKSDDLELENFVAHTNQRMSLRLYNKRRPADQNICSASPAVKRRMMNDVSNIQGISNPRLVSASTQMFTTPIKPLQASLKPLSDMVKPGHSRILPSNETEHVKVVDAMSYVPSPNDKYLGTHCLASPGISMGSTDMSTRHGEVFESSTAAADKYKQFASPRRRVRRRHSSGATTCFSSSPRNRYQASSKNSVAKELAHGKHSLLSPTSLPTDGMDISHISVAATVEPVKENTPKTRVLYSGTALLKENTNLTPCKFHRGTPPMPVNNSELREVLSQRI